LLGLPLVGGEVDIWGVGCILFEMLSGGMLFLCDSTGENNHPPLRGQLLINFLLATRRVHVVIYRTFGRPAELSDEEFLWRLRVGDKLKLEDFDIATFAPHSPDLVKQELESRLRAQFDGREDAIDLLLVSVAF